MDGSLFWRGLVIGLSIAAPVGPIGVLCIRRTLANGRLQGLVSGLGAATADATYGAVAGFGLTAVSSLLVNQQFWLRLVGGLFLVYLGAHRPDAPGLGAGGGGRVGAGRRLSLDAGADVDEPVDDPVLRGGVRRVGAGERRGQLRGGSRAGAGVLLGSAAWWLSLSSAVSLLRARFDLRAMRWVNVVSGAVIVGFGVVALISA